MKRRFVVNEGFGNRCTVCGHFFDEGDICSNRHKRMSIYEKLGKDFIEIEGEEAKEFLLLFEQEKKTGKEP